jgi:hypothetical protein
MRIRMLFVTDWRPFVALHVLQRDGGGSNNWGRSAAGDDGKEQDEVEVAGPCWFRA